MLGKSTGLVLDSESGSDPLVNLVAGLICYQLWYQGIPKGMQLTDSATQTQIAIEKSGIQQGQNIRLEIFPSSYFCDTENSYKTKTINQRVSDGSIGNERKKSMEVYNRVPNHLQVLPAGGIYMKDQAYLSIDNVMLAELEQIDGFLPFPLGWNINLFPIQLAPSTNIIDTCHQLSEGTNKEHYLNAVNYLRVATYSSLPLLPVLVPFVQLLLIGGQVEETLMELKNFCYSSNAILPNRSKRSKALREHKSLQLSDAGHRRRLMRLLKWKAAGLVPCTLLEATNKGAQHGDAWQKYWAATEILSQMNKESIYPFKIKCVCEAWMSKTIGRSKKLMKKKYLIRLEYVLFLLSLGNISEAYDSVKLYV